MASEMFDAGSDGITKGTISWTADTIKARLVASSVVPDRTASVMTGLTAIGTDQTLASKTQTKDTTNHQEHFDSADPTWTAVASGSTVGFIVVYKFVTTDSDSIPIALIDVTDLPTNGSDITYPVDANGWCYIQN